MTEEKIFVVSKNDWPHKAFVDEKQANDYAEEENKKMMENTEKGHYPVVYYGIKKIPLIKREEHYPLKKQL